MIFNKVNVGISSVNLPHILFKIVKHKTTNSIIYFFILCMVSLTMQSTVLSFNKAGKAYKLQSTTNNPFAEEEETHKEKESADDADDVVLFSENNAVFLESQPLSTLIWPRTTSRCFFHTPEILIPPPKFN